MNSPASHLPPKLHLRLYTGKRGFERTASLGQVQELLANEEGSYELEVLDGQAFRELAAQDEIALMPALVRVSPTPVVRLPMPQQSSDALRRALREA